MRPHRVVVVTGTGTDVGKTWVAQALITTLTKDGVRIAARKPAQSFSPEETTTDADRLAAATGETPTEVCPTHRWYPIALAPPMAAEVLHRPVPTLADLAGEIALSWPTHQVHIALVEGAGGVASPQASDGDTTDLCRAVTADVVVLVACDPGLGTINLVRLATRALAPWRVVVHLNRFDPAHDLHRLNRDWLADHDGLEVTTDIGDLANRIGSGARRPSSYRFSRIRPGFAG